MHSLQRVREVLFPADKSSTENFSNLLAGVGLAISLVLVGFIAVVLLGAIS
jgi:hypothetical protein